MFDKKAYQKEWRKRNPGYSKEYQRKNRERDKVRRKNWHLLNTFGITYEDYNKKFEEQKGCCAICGTHQTELSDALCVDHNHDSGEIRDLLCHPCNLAVGNLNEDIERANKLTNYLRKWKCKNSQ